MPWITGESVHSLAYYFGLACRGGHSHTKYQGGETQVMTTARILSWPAWQGEATDMQNIMEVQHRVSRVSDRDITTQDSMVDEQGGLATEVN